MKVLEELWINKFSSKRVSTEEFFRFHSGKTFVGNKINILRRNENGTLFRNVNCSDGTGPIVKIGEKVFVDGFVMCKIESAIDRLRSNSAAFANVIAASRAVSCSLSRISNLLIKQVVPL